MNFRKKKPIVEQPKLTLPIEELPDSALNITYQKFLDDYKKEQDSDKKSEIHQKLILISKILTDRAYQQGNGQYKKDAIKSIPGLTEQQYDSFSNDKKEQIKKYIEQKKNLDQVAKSLTSPEPQNIEFEMKVKTPTTIKTHSEHVEIGGEPNFFDKEHGDWEEKQSKPKKGLFAKLNEPVFQKSEKEIQEKQPKNKKPVLAFLKKKKKQQIPIPVSDELVQTIDKIHNEQPELFKKKVTPEQKERAKKMEIATKLKFGGFKKKKPKDVEERASLKGLDEIYCIECKHQIKDHQSGGIDNGCQKCGCFMTVADVAEANGIKLSKPKKVLDKIEQENSVQEIIEQKEENVDAQYIKKQAEKLATMVKKTPPPTSTVQTLKQNPNPNLKPVIKTVEEEIAEIERIEKAEVDKPITQPSQPTTSTTICVCDHAKSDHFNEGEFCQNTDCLCDKFKVYPK